MKGRERKRGGDRGEDKGREKGGNMLNLKNVL